MDRRSKHLSREERSVIFAEHDCGSSQRAIGQLLRRPASTICRELARGLQDDGSYCPQAARLVYDVRRRRCRRPHKLIEGGAIHRFVHDHLVHRRWAPQQIAHRLRLMNQGDPAARVSHETIYAAIYAQPRGGLKAAMIEALRQAKPARGLRRTTLAGNAMVPESLRIINRPEEIEARLMPGHWEGDLIEGAFNRSSVGTLTFLKNGRNKVPLYRVPALAQALEVDPAFLMRLALEQAVGATAAKAITQIFGTPTTENERGWLTDLRDALRGIFGK